jgi:hypothetical protein
MVVCLTGARFNMRADILRQGAVVNNKVEPTDEQGEWVMQQDPDSGEIIRVWQPVDGGGSTSTTTDDVELDTIDCIARGIVDGGIRVAGTTERFGDMYENVDFVSMTVGPNVQITKRDKVTNIRNARGIVLWRNEEMGDPAPPTVFSVLGVTPIPDPWGDLVEQRVMLERAERQ